VQLLSHGERFVVVWVNFSGDRILVSIFVDIGTGAHIQPLLRKGMFHVHPNAGVPVQPVLFSCDLDDLANSSLPGLHEGIDALSYLPIE
jgi:hypothetical protein